MAGELAEEVVRSGSDSRGRRPRPDGTRAASRRPADASRGRRRPRPQSARGVGNPPICSKAAPADQAVGRLRVRPVGVGQRDLLVHLAAGRDVAGARRLGMSSNRGRRPRERRRAGPAGVSKYRSRMSGAGSGVGVDEENPLRPRRADAGVARVPRRADLPGVEDPRRPAGGRRPAAWGRGGCRLRPARHRAPRRSDRVVGPSPRARPADPRTARSR